jgi:hypothetical protein
MKEVKIAYLNLNLKQKESIETLKEWMYKLWKTKEYTNGYSIYKYNRSGFRKSKKTLGYIPFISKTKQ